jgi:hypothetical protein
MTRLFLDCTRLFRDCTISTINRLGPCRTSGDWRPPPYPTARLKLFRFTVLVLAFLHFWIFARTNHLNKGGVFFEARGDDWEGRELF